MSRVSFFTIARYTAGITTTKAQAVAAFHLSIRSLLSSDYDTHLQGSYANDTEIRDINDVDIIAIHRSPGNLTWLQLFDDVHQKISTNLNYRGRVSRGNKCLKLVLQTLKADIVPAVRPTNIATNTHNEPIYINGGIHSRPKTHIYNGQQKNARTNDNYKKIVRMMKNYIAYWGIDAYAASFYAESLVHSYLDGMFTNDLPLSFYNICHHICYATNFDYSFKSVAGDKIIISNQEWQLINFQYFKQHLAANLPLLYAAVTTQNETEANRQFNAFFNN